MGAWIGVAAANHVARGRAGGFMQVNHGKRAPLARIQPGDIIIYYAPTTELGGGTKLQSFVAAGTVRAGELYMGYMGEGFTPWRRDVDWFEAEPVSILPLLDRLELTREKTNWGYGFRLGLIRISDHDRDVVLDAMQVRQVASE